MAKEIYKNALVPEKDMTSFSFFSTQVLIQSFYYRPYFITWNGGSIIPGRICKGSPVPFFIGFEIDDKTINLHFYAVRITPSFELPGIGQVLVPVPDRQFECIIHGKSKVKSKNSKEELVVQRSGCVPSELVMRLREQCA